MSIRWQVDGSQRLKPRLKAASRHKTRLRGSEIRSRVRAGGRCGRSPSGAVLTAAPSALPQREPQPGEAALERAHIAPDGLDGAAIQQAIGHQRGDQAHLVRPHAQRRHRRGADPQPARHRRRQGVARQGVATLLVDALEKLAGSRGAKSLTVDASDTAQGFFAKRGYTAQQRNSITLNDEWLANTTMKKTLEASQ